jgi:hypothetical protein
MKTFFAAARDAVGEEPIAAGGVQKIFRFGVPARPTASGRPNVWGRNSGPDVKRNMKLLPPPVTPSERNRSAWAVGSF